MDASAEKWEGSRTEPAYEALGSEGVNWSEKRQLARNQQGTRNLFVKSCCSLEDGAQTKTPPFQAGLTEKIEVDPDVSFFRHVLHLTQTSASWARDISVAVLPSSGLHLTRFTCLFTRFTRVSIGRLGSWECCPLCDLIAPNALCIGFSVDPA